MAFPSSSLGTRRKREDDLWEETLRRVIREELRTAG